MLRRRRGARHRWTRTSCSAGCATEDVEALYRAWRPPASASAERRRSPTSRVARAPSRASWRSRSRAGSASVLGEHLSERPDLVGGAPGARHQDQRLPERLRPAPRRRHRLPGQPAQGRRPGRAAVLRAWSAAASATADDVRTAGGEDSGAPLRRRRSSGWSSSITEQRPTASRRRVLPAGRGGAREGAARPISSGCRRKTAEPTGLHRSRRGQRVQPRGDGRGVQRLASREPPEASSQTCRRQPSHPFRCSTRSAARRCCGSARLGGVARRRDLREGGVPEPRRLGQGPRGRGDHRATPSARGGCGRAGSSSTRRRATPASPTR